MFESMDAVYIKDRRYRLEGRVNGVYHTKIVELRPDLSIADAIELAMEEFEQEIFDGHEM